MFNPLPLALKKIKKIIFKEFIGVLIGCTLVFCVDFVLGHNFMKNN